MRGKQMAAPTRRLCPDGPARDAFFGFSVTPGAHVALPPQVRAFLRLALIRTGCQQGALSILLGSDDPFLDNRAAVALDGRCTIGEAEWRRIRALVERLELEAERPRRARDDLGTLTSQALLERLGNQAMQSRERISAELVGRSMLGPFVQAHACDDDRARIARVKLPVRSQRQRFGDVPWAFAA
jgi:hypothetical protein